MICARKVVSLLLGSEYDFQKHDLEKNIMAKGMLCGMEAARPTATVTNASHQDQARQRSESDAQRLKAHLMRKIMLEKLFFLDAIGRAEWVFGSIGRALK